MVYQENVIRVAHNLCRNALGMSGCYTQRYERQVSFPAVFQHVKEKFFYNHKDKGYPGTEAGEIWQQIENFADYLYTLNSR